MANKYLDYAGLQRLVENINKKYAPIQAIVFKSTVEDIDSLPALNTVKAGFMYNIKTGGFTTDDFVEGAGHIVADGENIAAVELLTGNYTSVASPAATDDPKALGWFEATASVVTPIGTEDPAEEGWYEVDTVVSGAYIRTTDTAVDGSKTYYTVVFALSTDRIANTTKVYYTADSVMKWDLMGGVFDLEDRYLEFGDTFPQGPAFRMVDGRTFVYMGENTKVYTKVDTPEGRPTENNYFELDDATAVADLTTIYNPKQQQLYEEDDTDPSAVFYVLSEDTVVDDTKTYYECEFVASTDTSVDDSKIYYTEADQYKKGIIYQYDATEKEWIAQSSGGAEVESIPLKDIDDLFI